MKTTFVASSELIPLLLFLPKSHFSPLRGCGTDESLQHQSLFGNYVCTWGEFWHFNVLCMSWKVNASGHFGGKERIQ